MMSRPRSNSGSSARVAGGAACRAAAASVRMTRAELNPLLDELDAMDAATKVQSKRKFVRIPYRPGLPVALEIQQPGGSVTTPFVYTRNISRTGVSLIHGSFLHDGTRCAVTLPTRAGGEARLSGRVVRCRHVRGIVHEVGVLFDKPVDVGLFLARDAASDGLSSEHVDKAALVGRVLLLTSSAIDARIILEHLKDTGLSVVRANDQEAALDLATREQFDAAICDIESDDSGKGGILQLLRSHGLDAPVILLSAENSRSQRAALRESGVAAVVGKPMDHNALVRTLSDVFLMRDRSAATPAAVICSLPGDSPLLPIVDEFLTNLREHVQSVRRAIESGDLGAARPACLAIKGTAPSLGFEPLAHAATAALRALDRAGDGDARTVLSTLVSTCERARPRRAA